MSPPSQSRSSTIAVATCSVHGCHTDRARAITRDGGRNAQTVRRGAWTRPATDPCRARAHCRQTCARPCDSLAALDGPPGGEGGSAGEQPDLRPSVKRECDHVRSPVPQQAARVRDARADMQRRIEAVGDVELDLARRDDRYAEALGQNCGLGPWR